MSIKGQRGVSLIEVVVAIVIIGVAVSGVLTAYTAAVRSSADPMVAKQALSIAESLLEEISLMPFTYCDPDDPNAPLATAATAAQCPTILEAMGPDTIGSTTESRYGAVVTNDRFDNVNDYAGFTMAGILDIAGTPIAALAAYTASVTISPTALGGVAASDVNGAPQSLRITVTVTGPANTTVVLSGYRTRYAPNG